jgi:UDP:flavonoid glycosyltransferase YjiC (YdhE family)
MRILIATWDAAGGFPPERTIIRGLVARGHDVHVAAHTSLRSRVEAAGATFHVLPNIPDYDASRPITPQEERALVFDGVIFSAAFGNDVYDAARSLQPKVQLVDLALLTSALAAKAFGAPVGFLTHTIFKFYEWFGGQYAQRLESLRTFADRLAYKPPPTLLEMIGGSPVIASTYGPFELPATFPLGYLSVGPLREAVGAEASSWRKAPGKPLVLVSLSSGFMDQAATLSRLCKAVARLNVEAIVTTGDAIDPASLEAGPNTRVTRFVPHDVLLPMTRLVVTHAGHGTVAAAASYGVPMLLLPMGRDQPMIAARAAELGLGAVADFRASAADLAAAIERELADSARLASCRQFVTQLAGHPGLEQAIAAIEAMATCA